MITPTTPTRRWHIPRPRALALILAWALLALCQTPALADDWIHVPNYTPARISGNTATHTGNAIDVRAVKYLQATFTVSAPTGATLSLAGKLQSSHNGSTWSDYTTGTNYTTTATTNGAFSISTSGHQIQAPFARIVWTLSSASAASVNTVVVAKD